MIAVAEALAKIAALAPLGTERVPLAEAAGRVLAREVRADLDWPPFDTSAMDGYAVRAEDLSPAAAGLIERADAVAAGDPAPAPLSRGEAARIMTGAPLPPGTAAIVPVESARRDGGRVRFDTPPRAGAHIRRRGESVAAGAPLLERGRRLTALDAALLAMAGLDPVPVIRRPRVRIAVTGSEIVAAGVQPGPGSLRDSNGPMLLAFCRTRGVPAEAGPRVADEPAAVRRLFEEAGDGADLLLTTGGVSAGDWDLLPAEAAAAGFELLFHRVAVRPGKPIALARRRDTLWFGLPGNPVSASVGFHLFVREALDRLEGDSHPGAERISARLTGSIAAGGPRETYGNARWSVSAGRTEAEPLESRGSHDMASHARANALIRTPSGTPPRSPGEIVECLLLETARSSTP